MYMAYYLNSKKIVFYPGLKCKPKNWDKKKMRFKRGHPYWVEGNAILDNISTKLSSFLIQAKVNSKSVSVAEIKAHLAVIVGKGNKVSNLMQFIEKLISERKSDSRFAKGTVTAYNQTYNKLVKYRKATRRDLDFSDIHTEFLSQLIAWCYNEEDLSRNTVAKHVKHLKVFMDVATERGYNDNLAYRRKSFNLTEYEPGFVWLSMEELKQLKQHKYQSPRLAKVRDLLLVACFTGLRYSDFIRIGRNTIYQSGDTDIIQLFDVKSRKKKQLYIPVHPIVKELLLQYNYELPFISDVKINAYVKEACQVAGINQKVSLLKDDKGHEIEVIGPKWKFITTHTGRRSLITNWLLADQPIEDLRKMTGQSMQTLIRYNKITAEQNAVKISKNEFWLSAGGW